MQWFMRFVEFLQAKLINWLLFYKLFILEFSSLSFHVSASSFFGLSKVCTLSDNQERACIQSHIFYASWKNKYLQWKFISPVLAPPLQKQYLPSCLKRTKSSLLPMPKEPSKGRNAVRTGQFLLLLTQEDPLLGRLCHCIKSDSESHPVTKWGWLITIWYIFHFIFFWLSLPLIINHIWWLIHFKIKGKKYKCHMNLCGSNQ